MLRTSVWLILLARVYGAGRAPLISQPTTGQRRGGADGLGGRSDQVFFPGAPEDQRVDTYAGYMTVDERAGRALYYVLVESESSQSDAPVVLWLNGGPGCSSIGGGLMSELGPYYPTPDGAALKLNEFRWNRVANMIFLESPAFVGFSYSNSTADMTVGDERTAADTVAFLAGFFARYPALAHKPFWIAGESYAGHYVPNLAAALLRHNAQNEQSKIPLEGFLVGNAWSDAAIDNRGAVDFWWAHAIVSDGARDGILAHCDMSSVGPLRDAGAPAAESKHVDPVKCDAAVMLAMSNMGAINIYDIYVDVCLPQRVRLPAALLGGRLLSSQPNASRALSFEVAAMRQLSGEYDACIDNEVAVYLNRPEVQRAMHANLTGLVQGPWTDCSPRVQYSRADLLASMLPVYHELLKADLKILVYSGDVDAIVPVIGTRRWISGLGLDTTEPWRPWHTSSGQVGGYVEKYKGLVFATVRGAGHMVPFTQPGRAFHMFSRFVTGSPM